MRTSRTLPGLLVVLAATGLLVAGAARAGTPLEDPHHPQLDLSLVLEARGSLMRGGSFLLAQQQENGAWANHTVITSLATMAIANSPLAADPRYREAVGHALDYLARQSRDDGALWSERSRQYPLYSTALSVLGMVRVGRDQDQDVIRRARAFLLTGQVTDNPDDPAYGGFDGKHDGRPSLIVSQWVLEALYLTDYLEQPPYQVSEERRQQTINAYKHAVIFISRCQHAATTGHETDPADTGFFADFPGAKGAAKGQPPPGTPRSRAMLTLAGLKSLVHARVQLDNPHAVAAIRWLKHHYDVTVNPELDHVGYYTYLFTFCQAMRAIDAGVVTLADGSKQFWQRDVVLQLLKRQRGNGTWSQGNAEWWESHPELVTAYAMLMLEICLTPDVSSP